jgi:hypothetical protein
VVAGVFDDAPPTDAEQFGDELDAGFFFALTCFLDGVAVFIDRRSSTGKPSTDRDGD